MPNDQSMKGRPISVAEWDVMKERDKQKAKGYDAAHDDKYMVGRLQLAVGYLITKDWPSSFPMQPWVNRILNKHPRRQQLIIAAALLVAEVERMDREEGRKGQKMGQPDDKLVTSQAVKKYLESEEEKMEVENRRLHKEKCGGNIGSPAGTPFSYRCDKCGATWR